MIVFVMMIVVFISSCLMMSDYLWLNVLVMILVGTLYINAIIFCIILIVISLNGDKLVLEVVKFVETGLVYWVCMSAWLGLLI